MEKQCIICGRFIQGQANTRFCSRQCYKRYYKEYERNRPNTPPEPGMEPIRTFRCKKCGELIKVYSEEDKRRVFCSSHCEKLYWKHPHPKN